MVIATGYDRLGIELENYIGKYIPSSWIVPIRNVAHTPWIMTKEAKALMKSHNEGRLEEALKKLGPNFEPWYIKEAIKDYFNKEKYSKFREELD